MNPAPRLVWLIALPWLMWTCAQAVENTEESARDLWEDRLPTPYACEAWQDKIAEMAKSADSLTRELAEFYADEEHQWCQSRRRRVPEEREPWFNFDFSNADVIAEIARWLAISLLMILVLWAGWRWRRQLARWLPRLDTGKREQYQTVASRSALSSDSLSQPIDPVAEARRLWHDGQTRDALALLYRGMLQHYLGHQPSTGSLTEREALRALRQCKLQDERLAWCRQLTEAWLNTAWGHQPLETSGFEALLGQWPTDAAGYRPDPPGEPSR